MNRRKFIHFSMYVIGYSSSILNLSASNNNLKFYLRPPGAIDEKNFLSACIKCGQCVQVCPFYCLKILDIDHIFSIGTPYIDANERGCYLCDLFPCILACPSGALDHSITTINDIHMGIAIINNWEACLAYKNITLTKSMIKNNINIKIHNEREEKVANALKAQVNQKCDLCVRLCPYPQKEAAITMITKNSKNRPYIQEDCVGCGVCAEVCPVQIISIIPRASYSSIYRSDF